MNTKFKKFALLLLMVIVAFSLTGCGSADEAVKGVVSKYFAAKKAENKQDISSMLDITFTWVVQTNDGIYELSRDQYLSYLDNFFVNNEYHTLNPTYTSVLITGDVALVNCLCTEDYTYKGVRNTGIWPYEVTLTKRNGKWFITKVSE